MANGPTLPPQAYTREILAVAFQWLQGQPESIKKLAQSPDALVGLYLRAQRFGNQSAESDAPVTSQNFISDLKHLAEGLKQFEEPKLESRAMMPPRTTATGVPMNAPTQNPPLNPSLNPTTVRRGTTQQAQVQMSFTHATQSTQALRASQATQSAHAAHASHTSHAASHSTHSTQTSHVGQSLGNVQQNVHQNMHPSVHQNSLPNAHQSVHSNLHQSAHQGLQPANSWSLSPTSQTPPGTMMVPALPTPAEADLMQFLNPTSLAMIHEVKNCLNLSSDAEVLNMMVAMAYKSCKNLIG